MTASATHEATHCAFYWLTGTTQTLSEALQMNLDGRLEHVSFSCARIPFLCWTLVLVS